MKWNKNDKNGRWKGDNAGYQTFHQWMRRHYGNPDSCEGCGAKGKKEKGGRWSIHWALKRHHNHCHNRDAYQGLCRKCHGKYDMTPEKVAMFKEWSRRPLKPEVAKELARKRSLIAKSRRRDKYGHYIKTTA